MVLKDKKSLQDLIVASNISEMYTFCIRFNRKPKDCIWKWEDLLDF